MQKDRAMNTSFTNFAIQAAATLSLTGFLGFVLFTAADLATRGVIV